MREWLLGYFSGRNAVGATSEERMEAETDRVSGALTAEQIRRKYLRLRRAVRKEKG